MRQFILASGYVNTGAVAGQLTIVTSETNPMVANLVLKREVADGGDILFPIYKKGLTLVKASYDDANMAGATFEAYFTVPEITPYLDYTVTFVKKGKQFNDRSNWSACVHASGSDKAETVAKKIEKFVTDNPSLGLTATAEGAKVTVVAKTKGEDYTISFGDEMYGVLLEGPVEVEGKKLPRQGKPAFMDAAMIKDLFAKAAADAGYEYTYDNFDIYPGYDFNPLKQADAVDTGFDVFTLRFAEPRVMGTHEEDVYQIIQVVFPTNATGVDAFETAMKAAQ